jgi:hypothetical protein
MKKHFNFFHGMKKTVPLRNVNFFHGMKTVPLRNVNFFHGMKKTAIFWHETRMPYMNYV